MVYSNHRNLKVNFKDFSDRIIQETKKWKTLSEEFETHALRNLCPISSFYLIPRTLDAAVQKHSSKSCKSHMRAHVLFNKIAGCRLLTL